MNENMQKLSALINEVNTLIKNTEKETKELKAQYVKSRQEKLNEFINFCQERSKVSQELDILVQTNVISPYGEHIYLRMDKDQIGVKSGTTCWCGAIPFYNASYFDKDRWHSNLRFDLDKILDEFDYDFFDRKFMEAVQKALTQKAELANRNYADMKAKVERG